MKHLFTFLLLFNFTAIISCSGAKVLRDGPMVVNGLLDLETKTLDSQTIIPLKGDWQSTWGALVKNSAEWKRAVQGKETRLMSVPSDWSSLSKSQKGYMTYSMKILLPDDAPEMGIFMRDQQLASRLYANGEKIIDHGKVAPNAEGYTPRVDAGLGRLPKDKEINIFLQIANFDSPTGGIRTPLYFAPYGTLLKHSKVRNIFPSILFGLLLFIVFLNLFIFIYDKTEKIYLIFSCFALAHLIREFSLEPDYLFQFFPDVSYRFHMLVRYLSMGFIISTAFHFLQLVGTENYHKKLTLVSYIYTILLNALMFFLPTYSILKYASIGLQIHTIAALGYLVSIIFKKSTKDKHRKGQIILGATFAIILIAYINDILYIESITSSTILIFPYAFMLIVLMHTVLLLERFASSLYQSKKLNTAFKKFVPQEFLAFLVKNDITDIQLGDHMSQKMTILFSDIRDFTSISESITPNQTFQFLNSYLSRMGPVIRTHRGFIDKYIGDGILGLFPHRPDDAIDAAINFHKKLRNHNITRIDRGYIPIRTGIGLNTGNIMLGTIGENERMDTTVISDSVNIASRIENATKIFHSPALLTEATYRSLPDSKKYNLRKLNKIDIKGKDKPIEIYEVLDCYPDEHLRLFLESRKVFSEGLKCFEKRSYSEGKAAFEEVISSNPNDYAAKYFLERMSEFGNKKE